MKNPKKPIHPHKVELPTDKVKFTRTHELYHNYKVADIIKMLPENYPLDEAKIVFEDADDSYDVARTYLEYETEEPNIHLNGQMKAYHRKIKTYAKKMVKYEAWFKIEERRRKIEDAKNRIIKAEKDLKRLK
jgi:hypothetical protein